jgi:alcohol dehydrogenase class IV
MERLTVTNFEFATANRIIFGSGSTDQVADIAASFGERALLVTSDHVPSSATDRLEQRFLERHMALVRYAVNAEPDVETIEAGVRAAQAGECDHVIALGGGSVMDSGKAIAGLLTNAGSVLDYVEVVGRGESIRRAAAPLIAIPTTAGTGAEVTRNAVIAVPGKQVKVSMRSPYLLPRVAVVDPVMTHSVPPAVTASTGLDALTQLIEPYTSSRHNPITDALAEAGLRRAARSLLAAYQDGDPASREDMAFASLCGGLCLANSGLGAVHGFAAVLGGRYPIPHGVCCATLLPHVIRGNIQALRQREPDSEILNRYADTARIAADSADPEALIERITGWCSAMSIPGLSAFGVTVDAAPELVELAQQASSMKANPIKLTPGELTSILTAAL